MVVRIIKEEDIPAMVEIGELMHRVGSFKKVKYNKDKVFKTIRASIGSDVMAFFIAKDEDGYAGMIGGFIVEYSISYEKYASDFLMYIKEEKRGGDTAIRLLKLFEGWARSKGIKEIRLGSAHGVDTEEVKRFYEWQKYETIGHLFRKEL
jgi:GNAT superfamily N-acetyltransferase